MGIIYLSIITLVSIVDMALPASGVRPGTRPVRAGFNNVSPLAILIDSVDAYPNTWEHLSNDLHDPLPASNTPCYKHHARINMVDVESHLMASSTIRFDTDDFLFLEPQPPSRITLITRMCFSCFYIYCAYAYCVSVSSFNIFSGYYL